MSFEAIVDDGQRTTCDTGGGGHFWPQGDNLNKFGKGPLGDATYQISKL